MAPPNMLTRNPVKTEKILNPESKDLKYYKNAHKWMILPLAIVFVGFSFSYWGRFTETPLRLHLHGLTATGWFALLIIQPYLIRKGNLESHRTYGFIGLLLAGGVIISSLSVISGNIVNERMPDMAKYGLSFMDVVLLSGFTGSIYLAMRHRKSLKLHGRFMIASVLWVLLPGLTRMARIPLRLIYGGPENLPIHPLVVMLGSAIVISSILALLVYRDRHGLAWKNHPYTYVAVVNVVAVLAIVPMGNWPLWINFCNAVFTN